MGDMIYLIGGYLVFGGVTLIYVFSLVNRQKALRQEIESLQAMQQEDAARSQS